MLKTTAGQLRAALASVRPAVANWRRTSAAILATVKIAGSDVGGQAAACNCDVEIAAPFAGSGDMPARCVPFLQIWGVIFAMPGETEISLHAADGHALALRFAGGGYLFPGLPADDMPSVREGVSHYFSADADGGKLADALRWIAPFCSREFTRYYLCGACIDIADGVSRLVATDGHAMAWRRIPDMPAQARGLIVPLPVVQMLARRRDMLRISFNAEKFRCLVAAAGGGWIAFKTIEGTFPDFRRVIPAGDVKAEILCDAREMLAAGSRMMALANNGDNGRMITMASGPDGVTLARSHGASSPMAWTSAGPAAWERLAQAARMSGHPFEIAMSWQQWRRAAQASRAVAPEMRLQFFDGGSPMRFGDDDAGGLIMPMRGWKPAAEIVAAVGGGVA